MAQAVVSTWIPRSDTHVHEMAEKLPEVGLPIADIRVGHDLTFTITSRSGRRISACMKPYGLFTFKSEVEDGDVASYIDEISSMVVDEIFKGAQQVTYHQVKAGILPVAYHTTLYTGSPPQGRDAVSAGHLKAYLDPKQPYSVDSILYIVGDKRGQHTKSTDYFSYIVLAANYVNSMVETMSEIYEESRKVEELLDRKDFNEIRERMGEIASIRKSCSERYGKLMQAVSNFSHAKATFEGEDFDPEEQKLAQALHINDGFVRLRNDSDYLKPLWSDVLIKNLENLNFMVNTRLSLQQNIEAQKEAKEMKLLQAIFLVGVITSIIALGAMPGARLTLYNPEGILLAEGNIVSFQLRELISFGVIAVIASLGFFLVFNWAYMTLSKKLLR